MNDFATWMHAWCGAMRDCGYPNAQLSPCILAEGCSYTWMHDVNMVADPARWGEMDRAAWDVAHDCFVAVDALRPAFVAPSEALAERLAP